MPELIAEIIKPGLYTTIQDNGRYGYVNMGIPIGGAMDRESMERANQLVGNPINNPTLECTLIGPSIKFNASAQIAVCGAPFNLKINGELQPMYQTLNIETNDYLEVGESKEGCRAYLAIRGDWQEHKWLSSYASPSLYLKNFGLETKLLAGRKLKILTNEFITQKKLASNQRPIFTDHTIIRTTTSPDFEFFTLEVIEEFYESIFTISNDSNRMGYRLNENLTSYSKKREVLSSGVIPGTIQITNSGQPVILTADAQTTGGYPRIANVVRQDLDMVGQLRPGNKVKFQLTSLDG